MRPLEVTSSIEGRFDIEARWIEKLNPPFNQITHWNWTPEMIRRRTETRRANGGWEMTDKMLEAIRKANTGREGYWKGKTMSDSHVAGFSGGRSGHAKLTDEQADDIRRERAGGASAASLARQYGVSAKTIWRVAAGKTYTRRPTS